MLALKNAPHISLKRPIHINISVCIQVDQESSQALSLELFLHHS